MFYGYLRPRDGVWAAVFLGLSSFLVATSALASQSLVVGLQQMTRESDVIIRARVGAASVGLSDDKRRVITTTELEVLDGIKGAKKGELLRVYQVGGEHGGITMHIAGAIELIAGEEIIFFAKRYRDMIVSYGLGLGKYVIHTETTGAVMVRASFGDIGFVSVAPDGTIKPVKTPDDGPVLLADFVTRVRVAIKSGSFSDVGNDVGVGAPSAVGATE